MGVRVRCARGSLSVSWFLDALARVSDCRGSSALPAPRGSPMAEVTIDVREKKLLEIFNAMAGGHHVRALPAGDVQADFSSGRPGWVAER